MKKRMLSILMTLCMVLSLLPTTALADGNDTGMAMATNYGELVAALQDSTVTELTIYPKWQTGADEYDYFTWPEGEVTLNLDAANSVCHIYLANGTWTIPENVTVNAYDTVYIGAPTGTDIVINGTWNCMSNQAIIGNVSGGEGLYGALTVNGTMTVAKGLRVSPAQVGSFTLNGTLENAGVCYINNMTMANGTKVVNIPDPEIVNSMREIYLVDGGSITGPSTGSASIGGQITVSRTGTLSGNLTADQIRLYNGSTLTVADGTDVTIDKLSCNGTSSSPAAMNVNGKLSVTTDGYNTVSYTAITLGGNGVLAMSPTVQFGSSSSNSTIGGEGTLELYGILREWDDGDITCEDCPRIFGTSSDRTDENGDYVPLTGVDSAVTVKRMWEICTGHSWGEVTTVDPTCGDRGYDTATCTQCGTEKRSNYVAPTGEHTPSYEAWASNPSKVTVECSVCGQLEVITITATDGIYANGAAVETATLNNVPEWLTAPAIVYTNNTEPGTATASATFGDVTISVTFEISACAHENVTAATCTAGPTCSDCGKVLGDPLGHTGGTATCKEKATCTRCGERYGNTGYHTYVLKSNADMHWVECSVCGLDCLRDYGLDVTSPSQLPNEVLLEMIYVYLQQQGGGTIDQSIYLEQYGDTPSRHAYSSADADTCLLCGYTETTYTLSFETNGGSKIESVTKLSGETIDLTEYVPTRTGYDFEGWYSDAKLTDKITSVKLTGDMTVYAKWTKKGGENPFNDVADGIYYANAVIWAVGEDITSGTSATTFSPDAPCTRAQIVAFLWRTAGRPEPTTTSNPFTDVKADDYYYKAVLWAVENKIVYGIDATTFSPNQSCTRGQVAAFLWRAAGTPEPTTTNNPFHDVDASEYYGKAVVWAAENKIVYGTSATEFSPNAICTRAQIVTFLYRMYGK